MPDPQAVGKRRVDLKCLQSDPLLLFRTHDVERPHIVQAVTKLDEHDADIIDHRQEHLAQVFGLVSLLP